MGFNHFAVRYVQKGLLKEQAKSFKACEQLLKRAIPDGLPYQTLIASVREAIVDSFFEANTFQSTEQMWRGYFDHFVYAVKSSQNSKQSKKQECALSLLV